MQTGHRLMPMPGLMIYIAGLALAALLDYLHLLFHGFGKLGGCLFFVCVAHEVGEAAEASAFRLHRDAAERLSVLIEEDELRCVLTSGLVYLEHPDYQCVGRTRRKREAEVF